MDSFGMRRHRTAAYHPQANGMVERFHRQLKAALRCHAKTTPSWTDSLPAVLLGIRAAVKEDAGYSAAEMVYGSSLRLPGLLFLPPPSPVTPDEATATLIRSMRSFLAPPPRPVQRPFFVPRELSTATHVYVRVDRHRNPMAAPYNGPYRVIHRSDKTVTVNIDGREDTVSIDRVKPAVIEFNKDDIAPTANTPPTPNTVTLDNSKTTTTRTGRIVRRPVRFADTV